MLRDRVRILARTTEAAEEIDLERAQRAKDSSEAELKGGEDGDVIRRAEVRLKRALCRMNVHARTRN